MACSDGKFKRKASVPTLGMCRRSIVTGSLLCVERDEM